MAGEWNHQEVEDSLQRYRDYTERNKEELERIKGFTDELAHRMEAAEAERQKVEAAHKMLLERRGSSAIHYDLPDDLQYEQLQVELEWTRKRMDLILARLEAMKQERAAAATAAAAAAAAEAEAAKARQVRLLYEQNEANQRAQNEERAREAMMVKTQQLTLAEPLPDYDIDGAAKTKNGTVTETLEPLSKEETDNAVAMIEVMKHQGKLDSEEKKALLTDIVNHLEPQAPAANGVQFRRSQSSKKEKKLQESLVMLQEDLAANRDHTRLTAEDLSMLQYQLKSGKYKTRTLKQIRQGNTKTRVSLFEQL